MNEPKLHYAQREDLSTFRARLRTYHQYSALCEAAGSQPGLDFASFSEVLDFYDRTREKA